VAKLCEDGYNLPVVQNELQIPAQQKFGKMILFHTMGATAQRKQVLMSAPTSTHSLTMSVAQTNNRQYLMKLARDAG